MSRALHVESIKETQQQSHTTKRVVSEALEDILYEPFPVLDHGFVRVVDYMGDDTSIVQAARVSYGKGTKKSQEDQGLINYLMRHRHSTPFEMCEIKFHIKLPIFVARHWIRHRTANVNEYSARYSILDKEFYVPSPENLAGQSQTNKQCRGETVSSEEAARVLYLLKRDAEQAYASYQEMMNIDENGNVLNKDHMGIARELARLSLPVNYYTQWYWKIDLHNLLHFLSLRSDPTAQYEIRVYADVMIDLLKKWVPMTYEAFRSYRLGGTYVSEKGLEAIRLMLAGKPVKPEDVGMGAREWQELLAHLGRS